MKKLNKPAYFLFYGIVCSNLLIPLYFLLYLPSFIIWRIERIAIESPFADPVLVLQLAANLALWATAYLILSSSKSRRDFFFFTLLFINVSYAYSFLPVLTTSHIIPLFTFVELLFILFSLILTLLWGKIWRSKSPLGLWLILPILIDIVLVLWESPGSQTGMIFRNFWWLGTELNKLTDFRLNLFFLDFTGFAVLFLNLINSLFNYILIGLRTSK